MAQHLLGFSRMVIDGASRPGARSHLCHKHPALCENLQRTAARRADDSSSNVLRLDPCSPGPGWICPALLCPATARGITHSLCSVCSPCGSAFVLAGRLKLSMCSH